MLKVLNRRTLQFSFPEVHEDAILDIEFIRTFRVPEDGRVNALPPGFETFEIDFLENYKPQLAASWGENKTLLFPMYQADAMWINFDSPNQYRFAVRIGSGNLCAVTGEPWMPGLVHHESGLPTSLQNYVPVPIQPFLDGFKTGENEVRQFVAARLGQGVTVEEQLTGKDCVGGIQIQVYPLKAACWSGSDDELTPCLNKVCSAERKDMGLEAGGLIAQTIVMDDHLIDDYDVRYSTQAFIHIVNAEAWQELTGREMPSPPVTAELYNACQLPWYEWYNEGQAVSGSPRLTKVKSVCELDKGIAEKDKQIPEQDNIVKIEVDAFKD